MGSLVRPSIRRVAIVGAGPAGVTTAKYLLSEDHFSQVDVFEQQSRFGGVWNYSDADKDARVSIPQTNPNQPLEKPEWRTVEGKPSEPVFATPMYDGLETNIPHTLMRYSDAHALEDSQLFPTREKVLDYLELYSSEVKERVRLHTQVIDVQLETDGNQDVWSLRSHDLNTEQTSTRDYDAVVVANGHYSVPSVPNIPGLSIWNKAYPEAVSHSRFYRRPEAYRDQKVLVIGSSASGTDIASQISTVAKLPVIVSQRSVSHLSYSASYKQTLPEIAEFLPPDAANRAVRFVDGTVATDIDAVLFCTGYYYSFPFLSSLKPPLITTGERVECLYQHLFYIPHPSLSFVGLPSKIIPFRTFEGQAAVISRVWAGRLDLPPEDLMSEWERRLIEERGTGKPFHVLNFPQDFNYHNDMVAWALQAKNSGRGRVPSPWSEKETWERARFPAIKKAFIDCGGDRRRVRALEDLGFVYETSKD